jgi:hypothetical protein
MTSTSESTVVVLLVGRRAFGFFEKTGAHADLTKATKIATETDATSLRIFPHEDLFNRGVAGRRSQRTMSQMVGFPSRSRVSRAVTLPRTTDEQAEARITGLCI